MTRRVNPPAFDFYADDFLAGSVATMEIEEIGVYTLLLALDWTLNGLPVEVEKLARLVRVSSRKFRKIWPSIEAKFPVSDGRRRNPRLMLERERKSQRSQKAADSAHSRWNTNAHANASANADAREMLPSPIPTPYTEERVLKVKKEKPSVAPKRRVGPGKFDLAPFIDLHREFFPDSRPPAGKYAATLKPLALQHGADEVLVRMRLCYEREGRWASPQKLAEHWPMYDGSNTHGLGEEEVLRKASPEMRAKIARIESLMAEDAVEEARER